MKKIVCIAVSFMFLVPIFAQDYWQSIQRSDIVVGTEDIRQINPFEYSTHNLDLEKIISELSRAPKEEQALVQGKGIKINFPMPNGELREFTVWEAPVMQSGLAAKYPNLKSYKGYTTSGTHQIIRFDTGNYGLHACITSPEGQIYIDPIFTNRTDVYQTYYTKNQETPADYVSACGLEHTAEEIQGAHQHMSSVREETVPLRIYRLAVATTGEYGQIAGSASNALSRVVTGVTRLNQMFENEYSVRFVLIDDNDKLIFTDPNTDPYIINGGPGNAHPGRDVLSQNQNVINAIIPLNSYDVGHVFTRSCTDGIAGVAAFGSACNSNKASGVSCVGNANVASFMVNTTAHEIGHQFAASHTWSNCPGAEEQLAIQTAFEPGSGSTIMSYAGACGSANNVVFTNDDYFHAGSLDQMKFFINDPTDCAEKVETGNHPPVVFIEYEENLTIPVYTPFELTGTATDMDGDNMTFNWEQMNNGGALLPLGNPNGNSPSFRSVYPSESPTRIFPKLSSIIANFAEDTEVIPDESRSFDFRFVARDNHPMGGTTSWADMSFNSFAGAGPFFVQSPNLSPDDVEVGQEMEVTWDVSNTDVPPVNCTAVDIFLSADNGENFDFLLLKNTPNDGQAMVTIPNAITSQARIKVKASNNIFFDISNQTFDILAPSAPTFIYDVSETLFDLCLPQNVAVDIQSFAFLGYSDEVTYSIAGGLPNGAIATINPETIAPDGSATLDFNLDGVTDSGVFDVLLQAVSAGDTSITTITLNLTANGYEDLSTVFPGNGEAGIAQLPTFSWTNARNADFYTFELSDNPAFGETNIIFEAGITDTFFTPSEILDRSTLYYWRVNPSNICNSGFSTGIRTFGTLALSCSNKSADDLPKNISQSGLPTIESRIPIFEDGNISAISIGKIKGLHDNTGDLTGVLVSPSGTEVVLFDRICGNSTNFNCGFSDDSPNNVGCSLNTGSNYFPEEPLSTLVGEPISGDWVLRLIDNAAGNGGALQEINLEICSNQTLNPPVLVINDTLQIPTNLAGPLSNEKLLVEDENNSADELIYTLISLPAFGHLELNGELMEVGTRFTQQNINNIDVRYLHSGDDTDSDSFEFTVIDGEGGFINITRHEIFIGPDVISSTNDLNKQFLQVDVMPNPAQSFAHVEVLNPNNVDYNISIVDINGRIISTQTGLNKTGSTTLQIDNLDAGIYMILVETEGQSVVKRLSVIR